MKTINELRSARTSTAGAMSILAGCIGFLYLLIAETTAELIAGDAWERHKSLSALATGLVLASVFSASKATTEWQGTLRILSAPPRSSQERDYAIARTAFLTAATALLNLAVLIVSWAILMSGFRTEMWPFSITESVMAAVLPLGITASVAVLVKAHFIERSFKHT